MNEFFSQLLTYQSNFNHTNCSTNHQCSCTGSEWFHVKIICACWRHFLSKRELLFCWFAELRRRLLKSFFSAKISYISRNLLSKHSARMKVAEITQAKSLQIWWISRHNFTRVWFRSLMIWRKKQRARKIMPMAPKNEF